MTPVSRRKDNHLPGDGRDADAGLTSLLDRGCSAGSTGLPPGSLRFDAWMTLLTGWFTAGFFIDAYAHHNNVPESFFTPWHAVLYAGFVASAGFTLLTAYRNRKLGYPWRRSLPVGYWPTAVLMGGILLAAGRWALPFGSLSLIIGLNGLGMAVLEDEWRMVAVALIGGFIADLLYRKVYSRSSRWFAFLVPVGLFGVYQLWLVLSGAMGWSVHLWTGSVVIAGLVGVLVSFLCFGFSGEGELG